MTRAAALALAARHFDEGHLLADLRRRVAHRTESQDAAAGPRLAAYLADEIAPALARLGCTITMLGDPQDPSRPGFLVAERIERPDALTVFMYAHGDVVRGYERDWRAGLDPWTLAVEGDRWYGRGTADNKGQHTINLAALETVSALRGSLGFNLKVLFEMGEEVGSPSLDALCKLHRDRLRADVFLSSDGPRVAADRPTLFLGSRGIVNFTLSVRLRAGGHHSGNWGGVLANPATMLAGALHSLVSAQGVLKVPALLPPPVSQAVRSALSGVPIGDDAGDAKVDPSWGEPSLTPVERVIAWNSLEVLAFTAGNPAQPANAIPPSATAHCQLRFVVGTDWERLAGHLRAHLDRHGFDRVEVTVARGSPATRMEPDAPWARWAVDSIGRTTGKPVAILPNLGGTLPNEVFARTLGLPTLWVPHSYPACSQHAANEHLLASVAREGLAIMTGLYWDLGEAGSRMPA